MLCTGLRPFRYPSLLCLGQRETNFLDYYRAMCEKRHGSTDSNGNWGNWHSCLKHLERYCKPNTTFKDITPEWIEGFREYLDKTARCRDKRKKIVTDEISKPLSQNSKVSYFNKLRACINQAFDDRIMPHNPLRGIEGFKAGESERCYLTLDEVKAMAAAHCKYPALKKAFMFSCLTGIRKSDIEKMRWKEVQQHGEFTRIIFKQKKTGGQEYLDINPQAASYLGERGKPDDRVFVGFKYSSYMITELRMWAVRAGITKDITFRPAHFRRFDARPRSRNLYPAKITRTQRDSDHPNIRQDSRQKEARGRVDDTEHIAGRNRQRIAATAFS